MNPVSLLTSGAAKEASGLIESVGNTLDKFVTSDQERKEAQLQLERLQSLSNNWFIAGGRSAMMWALSAGIFYQLALRDIAAGLFGIENMPKLDVDVSELVEQAFQLMAGTL